MAAACVSRIPDEILVSEILVRLPASGVLRLRSVCRSWRRLTTDPSFVRAHTARSCVGSAVEPIVYPLDDNQRLNAQDVSALQIRRSSPVDRSRSILRLLASCDGLLCFQSGHWMEPMPYHVCNPVTRIWTTVPVSGDRNSAYHRCLCGFYFHRPTQKYRLLQYSSNYVNDRCQDTYEVATVGDEDKSWRTIYGLIRVTARGWAYPAKDKYDGAEALALFGLKVPDSVQVNGSLHWVHAVPGAKLGIVAFDTESEKFSRMSAPQDLRKCNGLRTTKFRIRKIRGNLCVGRITKVSRNAGEEETILDLWMLKDYAKQQWVKLRTIQPNRGGVGDSEEDEEGELMVRWGRDNFKLNTFKLTSFDVDVYAWVLIPYTESLVDPRT